MHKSRRIDAKLCTPVREHETRDIQLRGIVSGPNDPRAFVGKSVRNEGGVRMIKTIPKLFGFQRNYQSVGIHV